MRVRIPLTKLRFTTGTSRWKVHRLAPAVFQLRRNSKGKLRGVSYWGPRFSLGLDNFGLYLRVGKWWLSVYPDPLLERWRPFRSRVSKLREEVEELQFQTDWMWERLHDLDAELDRLLNHEADRLFSWDEDDRDLAEIVSDGNSYGDQLLLHDLQLDLD